MATKLAVWHGTDEELKALWAAVGRNCECSEGQPQCRAHEMLSDQDTLNHLVFVKRIARRLRRGEAIVSGRYDR